MLGYFPSFSLLTVWCHYGEEIHSVIQLLRLGDLFHYSEYAVSWWMFHGCIVQWSVLYICQLNPVLYSSIQSQLIFLATSSVHCLEWDVEDPNYTCRFVCFSFQLCQFLPYLFWGSVVCSTYVELCLPSGSIFYQYFSSKFICTGDYFFW